MKLVYKNDQAQRVELGDKVSVYFDGLRQTGTIIQFEKPHKPSSEGKVTVSFANGSREFYVSVIGAVWIDREDQVVATKAPQVYVTDGAHLIETFRSNDNGEKYHFLDLLDPVQLGFIYESLMNSHNENCYSRILANGDIEQRATHYYAMAQSIVDGIESNCGMEDYKKQTQALSRKLANYDKVEPKPTDSLHLSINPTKPITIHGKADDMEWTLDCDHANGWYLRLCGLKDWVNDVWETQCVQVSAEEAAAITALFITGGERIDDDITKRFYVIAERVFKNLPKHLRIIP